MSWWCWYKSGVLFQYPGFLIASLVGAGAANFLKRPAPWLEGIVAGVHACILHKPRCDMPQAEAHNALHAPQCPLSESARLGQRACRSDEVVTKSAVLDFKVTCISHFALTIACNDYCHSCCMGHTSPTHLATWRETRLTST